MQNHHLASISTSLEIFARRIFFTAEPISEHKYTMLLDILPLFVFVVVILLVLLEVFD